MSTTAAQIGRYVHAQIRRFLVVLRLALLLIVAIDRFGLDGNSLDRDGWLLRLLLLRMRLWSHRRIRPSGRHLLPEQRYVLDVLQLSGISQESASGKRVLIKETLDLRNK